MVSWWWKCKGENTTEKELWKWTVDWWLDHWIPHSCKQSWEWLVRVLHLTKQILFRLFEFPDARVISWLKQYLVGGVLQFSAQRMECAEACLKSVLPQLHAGPVHQGLIVVVPTTNHGYADFLKMKQGRHNYTAAGEQHMSFRSTASTDLTSVSKADT